MRSESFMFYKRVLIFHFSCLKNGSKVDGRELPQGRKARSFLMSAICWELWILLGYIWDSFMTLLEYFWNTFGILLLYIWDLFGILLDIFEYFKKKCVWQVWLLLGNFGYFWVIFDIFGFFINVLGILGYFWVLLDIVCYFWVLLDTFFGYFWVLMVLLVLLLLFCTFWYFLTF